MGMTKTAAIGRMLIPWIGWAMSRPVNSKKSKERNILYPVWSITHAMCYDICFDTIPTAEIAIKEERTSCVVAEHRDKTWDSGKLMAAIPTEPSAA
jgi:hypothetical protein